MKISFSKNNFLTSYNLNKKKINLIENKKK